MYKYCVCHICGFYCGADDKFKTFKEKWVLNG